MELSDCPPHPDEVADAYLMARLSEAEVAPYERHFLGCPQCAERLLNTWDFISGVRGVKLRVSTDSMGDGCECWARLWWYDSYALVDVFMKRHHWRISLSDVGR